MKKISIWLMLIICTLIYSSSVWAVDKMTALGAKSITGNSASLDAITNTNYKNGAICMVPIINDKVYFYIYDGTENSAESLPDIVIPNDNISGMGAWKRIGTYTTDVATKWLVGNGVPQQEDGVENDFYFNEATSDIYVKNQPSIENMMTGGTASGVVNAANAFDNDIATVTDPTAVPASITYDLGAGVTLVPREALIKPADNDTLTNFTISGSNNNTDWTVLATQTTEEGTSFERSVDFETELGYRYFKLTCTEASADFSIAYWKMSPVRIDWTLLVNITGDGTDWLFGDELPDSGDGNINDFYLNTTTYDIYNKTDVDNWDIIGNITGTRGIDGTIWLSGDEEPDTILGNIGDYYLHLPTSDIYTKGFLYDDANILLSGIDFQSTIPNIALWFDEDIATFNDSTPAPNSAIYDFGSGTPIYITDTSVYFEGTGVSWSVYGSNDSSNWDILGSDINTISGWNLMEITNNDISYRYIRLSITNSDDGIRISEWVIHQSPPMWGIITNIKGKDGTKWSNGSIEPVEAADDGDYYLVTEGIDIGNVYEYRTIGEAGWYLLCNIKGPSAINEGVLAAPCVSVEPADPAPGEFVIWTNAIDLGMDGAVDLGDEGDTMIKVNIGGIINIGKLFDYSTGVWRNPS